MCECMLVCIFFKYIVLWDFDVTVDNGKKKNWLSVFKSKSSTYIQVIHNYNWIHHKNYLLFRQELAQVYKRIIHRKQMSRASLRPNDLPELGAKLIHELTSSFTISVTYLDQLPKCLDSGLKQHRDRNHNSDKMAHSTLIWCVSICCVDG